MHKNLIACFLAALITGASPAAMAEDGGDPESRANAAVANILFDQDADEFTSYRVNERGFVDVIFARNTPDDVYSAILNKLKNNPEINGVIAGKGGPACGRF